MWNTKTGDKLAQLDSGKHCVPLFSPDGKYLATTPNGITLWRTDNWQPLRSLNAVGTTPSGLGIAFSPDSRVLAVKHVGGAISLIDPATGAEWARLPEGISAVATVMSFSPDQRYLITSSADETSPSQIWNLAALRRALSDRDLDWPADVLEAQPSQTVFEQKLEVVLEDDGMFRQVGGDK